VSFAARADRILVMEDGRCALAAKVMRSGEATSGVSGAGRIHLTRADGAQTTTLHLALCRREGYRPNPTNSCAVRHRWVTSRGDGGVQPSGRHASDPLSSEWRYTPVTSADKDDRLRHLPGYLGTAMKAFGSATVRVRPTRGNGVSQPYSQEAGTNDRHPSGAERIHQDRPQEAAKKRTKTPTTLLSRY
jgi:hypothetical protein